MHPNLKTDIEKVKKLDELIDNALGARNKLIEFAKSAGSNLMSGSLESWINEAHTLKDKTLLKVGRITVDEAKP